MSESRQLKQLSPADTFMLSVETPTVHAHTGGLTVVDPGERTDFSLDDVERVLAERIHLVPRFQWKLEEGSSSFDRPYFVEDANFDVGRHIRRIAVASPGGLRQLAELAGHLHSTPVRRTRALWETWLIDGLEGGRVAMYTKTHHCLMDGASGAGLAEVLCDLSPDGGPIAQPPQLRESARPPTSFERLTRGLSNGLELPGRTAHHLWSAVRSRVSPGHAGPDFDLVGFNGVLGPERGFACVSVSLEDLKSIRKALDVTINDIVLALTSGALRTYLLAHNDLPERSLVASVPVSTRSQGDDSLGNQLTNISVGLATDVAKAKTRLKRIHRDMERAKQDASKGGVDLMAAVAESLLPGIARLAMGAMEGTVPDFLPANLVVSNVRGTPVPLYVAGARIESMCPMSMLNPGLGLNVTVMSYLDRIDFGFVFDPDLVPDAWTLAEAVPHELEKLQRAAA